MKNLNKRHLLLILLVLVAVALVPLFAPVSAETVKFGDGTWITGHLTYTWSADSDGTFDNGAAGSVTFSGNTMTVTATNSKYVDPPCGIGSATEAQPTTTTVTVTNVSDYPLLVTRLNTSGEAKSTIEQGGMIGPNKTFMITVNAPARDFSTEVKGTVTIEVEEQKSVTVTLAPSPYVGYTVNGCTVEQNGTEQTFTTEVGTTISLPSVTAPDGYEFMGWRVGGPIVTGSSFEVNNACMVFPVIVSAGADLNGENFKVGSSTYTVWEDAVTAAMTANPKVIVVNATEVTLPANVLDNLLPASGGTYVKPMESGVEYILPEGVTLLIPYNDTNTVVTNEPSAVNTKTTAKNTSAYRTLTLASGAHLTVNGSLSLAAQQSQTQGSNGCTMGKYGSLHTQEGSSIELNSGSNLYCWGYLWGAGTVTAHSGSTTYEPFQIIDFRGGTATSRMDKSTKIFPFNQYYVQNIEIPISFEYGAKEIARSVLGAGGGPTPTSFSLIDKSGESAFFTIESGTTLTKHYDVANDRCIFDLNGNADLNPITLKVQISIDSSKYVLPLHGGFGIRIHSGTMTVKNDMLLQPGAEVILDQGATMQLPKNVYIYDSEQWGNYAFSNVQFASILYSPSGTENFRKNVPGDANIDVNGTAYISGHLFTTDGGADITSSEGTGQIVFTAAQTSTGTVKQAKQTGTTVSYETHNVSHCYLHNDISTWDGDEYTDARGSTANTTFYYLKDNWQKEQNYDLTYLVSGVKCGTVSANNLAGTELLTSVCTPEGYTHVGWSETPEFGAVDTILTGIYYPRKALSLYAVFQKTADGSYMVSDATVSGHDFGELTVTEEATCTETGIKSATCSLCGSTTYEEIPATGHTPVTDAAQAPTCMETGRTEGSHCSVCGTVFTPQEIVPKLVHDFGAFTVTKEATCTETGLESATCSRCGATNVEEIQELGHDYVDHAAQAPTCTEIGWNAYQTCSRCDYSTYKEREALGHDYVNHEAQAATCTEIGWDAYRTCSRCDYTTKVEIPALDHDYVSHEAKAATCTAVGWNEYQTCSRCDYTTYAEIPALGHDYIDHEAQAPTCTAVGWNAYQTCSRCDYSTYDEKEALGHKYVDGACEFCEKAEEIEGLKIKSAYLKLNQNINILFNAEVGEDMQNPCMVVTLNGVEYPPLQSSGKDARGEYLVFEFTNISPNMMGDTICATLYATDSSGNRVCTSLRNYSIRKYCQNLQSSYSNDAELQKLLNDVLVYGAAAQKYTGHNVDALVTDQKVENFDPPESSALNFVGKENKQYFWKCAELTLDNAVTVCLTLSAAPGATVEVSVNGRKQVFCYANIVTDDPNVCVVNFRNLSPVEFGDTITAVIKVDGEQVGQTLEYSVNSYVYNMYKDESNPALAELLKALYNYGESVKSYFK